MSEREPNATVAPQAAEASAAGLGTEPPSRSESAAGTVTGDELLAISAEAREAAKAVLDRGERWLAWHPLQHFRLRRRLVHANAALVDGRARWDRSGPT